MSLAAEGAKEEGGGGGGGIYAAAAASPSTPPLQLLHERLVFSRAAMAIGGLFSLWSAANIARGTDDSAIVLWLLLLGSGLVCHFTQLEQRAHIIAFAVCSYTACCCLALVFLGVAALFGDFFPCEVGPCAGGEDARCVSNTTGVRVYPSCDPHYATWSSAQIVGYRVFCCAGAFGSLFGLHRAGRLTRESWKASVAEQGGVGVQ